MFIFIIKPEVIVDASASHFDFYFHGIEIQRLYQSEIGIKNYCLVKIYFDKGISSKIQNPKSKIQNPKSGVRVQESFQFHHLSVKFGIGVKTYPVAQVYIA